MSSDWPTVRLGDLSDLLTGFPFKSTQYTEDPADPRLLRGDNIAQGVLRWDGVKRWSIQQKENINDYWLQEGDVVLAMDRPWIEAGLKYAQIRPTDLPALLVQRVARLRGSHRLHTRFLAYVIASPAFTQYILGVQTGTAVPHISASQIKDFEFRLPSRLEQEAIADILGTLDDKIELNRNLYNGLELITHSLFKAWFVDFVPVRAKADGSWQRDKAMPGLTAELYDLFPCDLIRDDLIKEIPHGWSLVPLASLSDKISKGTTPTRNDITLAPDAPTIPFLKVKDITDDGQIIPGGIEKIPESVHQGVLKRSILAAGDILFSIAGTIGRVAVVDGELSNSNANQAIAFVRLKNQDKHFGLTLMNLKSSRIQELAHRVTVQGVQANVSLASVGQFPIVLPSEQVLNKWNHIFSSCHLKQAQLKRESAILLEMRDLLLPNLMSGKLRIKEGERLIAGSVL